MKAVRRKCSISFKTKVVLETIKEQSVLQNGTFVIEKIEKINSFIGFDQLFYDKPYFSRIVM